MFYLVNNGLKYADICFNKDDIPSEKIIAEIDGVYDASYMYLITDDGYQTVRRDINEETNPKNITVRVGEING